MFGFPYWRRMSGFSTTRRRSLGAGRRALLDQGADLLGLGLEADELALEELALQRESLLRILGLNQLVGEIEAALTFCSVKLSACAPTDFAFFCAASAASSAAPIVFWATVTKPRTPCAPGRRCVRRNREARWESQTGVGHGRSRLRRPLVGGFGWRAYRLIIAAVQHNFAPQHALTVLPGGGDGAHERRAQPLSFW